MSRLQMACKVDVEDSADVVDGAEDGLSDDSGSQLDDESSRGPGRLGSRLGRTRVGGGKRPSEHHGYDMRKRLDHPQAISSCWTPPKVCLVIRTGRMCISEHHACKMRPVHAMLYSSCW